MNIPHSDPLVFSVPSAISPTSRCSTALVRHSSCGFDLGLRFHRQKYPSGHWNSHKKPKKDEALLSERPLGAARFRATAGASGERKPMAPLDRHSSRLSALYPPVGDSGVGSLAEARSVVIAVCRSLI